MKMVLVDQPAPPVHDQVVNVHQSATTEVDTCVPLRAAPPAAGSVPVLAAAPPVASPAARSAIPVAPPPDPAAAAHSAPPPPPRTPRCCTGRHAADYRAGPCRSPAR